MPKCAVIDVGSNTSKLLVAEVRNGTIQSVYYQKSYPCRISSEKKAGNQLLLSKAKIVQLIATIRLLHSKSINFQPCTTIVVGTEALRLTQNIAELKDGILQATGLSLSVLTGKQEAEGIALGIKTDPQFDKLESFHAFDLGGGSLEVLEVKQNKVALKASMPLGCVALLQKFIKEPAEPLGEKEQSLIFSTTKELLVSNLPKLKPCRFLIASGGTIVHLRKILDEKVSFDRAYIQQLTESMCGLNMTERKIRYPQIPADRLDILPVGLLTILAVMEVLHIHKIHHTFHNLRYGLAVHPALIH
jgi:exopolyphosphatase/guanosine-5'-triphosphate,3'-diphosphate pyrophosphatase